MTRHSRGRLTWARLLSAAAMAVVVSLLAGCGSGGGGTSSAAGSGGKRISVGMLTLANDPAFATYLAGARRAAHEFNIDLSVQQVADASAAESSRALRLMGTSRPDAIATTVFEPDALKALLKNLAGRGTKIVTYESPAPNPEMMSAETDVSMDWQELGRLTGEALVKGVHGKGKVLGFSGYPGLQSLEQHEIGLKKVLAAHPDIKYLGMEYNNFEPAKTASILKAVLARNPDLAGVYLGTSVGGAAQGGTAVLRQAGLIGKVATVAIDAEPDAVKQLKAGYIDAIISPDADEIGYRTIKAARDAVDGKQLPATIHLGDPCWITRENLNDADAKRCLYVSP